MEPRSGFSGPPFLCFFQDFLNLWMVRNGEFLQEWVSKFSQMSMEVELHGEVYDWLSSRSFDLLEVVLQRGFGCEEMGVEK